MKYIEKLSLLSEMLEHQAIEPDDAKLHLEKLGTPNIGKNEIKSLVETYQLRIALMLDDRESIKRILLQTKCLQDDGLLDLALLALVDCELVENDITNIRKAFKVLFSNDRGQEASLFARAASVIGHKYTENIIRELLEIEKNTDDLISELSAILFSTEYPEWKRVLAGHILLALDKNRQFYLQFIEKVKNGEYTKSQKSILENITRYYTDIGVAESDEEIERLSEVFDFCEYPNVETLVAYHSYNQCTSDLGREIILHTLDKLKDEEALEVLYYIITEIEMDLPECTTNREYQVRAHRIYQRNHGRFNEDCKLHQTTELVQDKIKSSLYSEATIVAILRTKYLQ